HAPGALYQRRGLQRHSLHFSAAAPGALRAPGAGRPDRGRCEDWLVRRGGAPMVGDVKTGSSEAGASVNAGTHHPEKSHSVRAYAPTGHRHTAEVIQELGLTNVHLSMTAVDMVRGALAAAHAFVKPGTQEKDLWKAYRA